MLKHESKFNLDDHCSYKSETDIIIFIMSFNVGL